MSAADTSPSRPSMIAKYATGTTTVTTRLTNVTFSSNGTAASSLRLTRCQKCLTSRTVKGSRHRVKYLLLNGGEAERRRQLGQALDARDVEVPAASGPVEQDRRAAVGHGALDVVFDTVADHHRVRRRDAE